MVCRGFFEAIMKKIICVTLVLSLFLLTACGNMHTSSYKATLFSHSSTASHCRAKFGSLDGRFVMKLHNKGGDGVLYYSAALDAGEMKVYYEWNGVRQELLTLKDGETVQSSGGYIGNGTIYIILETVSPCKGEIKISLSEEEL